MKNQQQLWNDLHVKRRLSKYSQAATSFANEIISLIPPASRILDIGCGIGNDSSYFATHGFTVVGTDFSEVVIRDNKDTFKHIPNLSFEILDTGKIPYPFEDHAFDVVYARLALHYFTDDMTRKVFEEIRRILKPGGYFCFTCKSTADVLYGKGEKIEDTMYEFEGHVRHFFSEEYTKELLQHQFDIVIMESKKENVYGRENSAYIQVVARK